jgi:hypothetical protein
MLNVLLADREAAKLQLAELAQLHAALKASTKRWRRSMPVACAAERAMRTRRACAANRPT